MSAPFVCEMKPGAEPGLARWRVKTTTGYGNGMSASVSLSVDALTGPAAITAAEAWLKAHALSELWVVGVERLFGLPVGDGRR